MKDWSDDEIFSLIDEWATMEELFNNRNALYHNKDVRAKALGIIGRTLADIDIIASVKQIQEKKTNFRNYYAAELRKSTASKTSGSGTDTVYTSNWKFFKSLNFLRC